MNSFLCVLLLYIESYVRTESVLTNILVKFLFQQIL